MQLSKSKESIKEPTVTTAALSSNNSTPSKQSSSQQSTQKEDDSASMKSGLSTDTNSWVTLDSECDEESLRQKEQHLQNVGLLTHKAAEKRRQEFIQKAAANAEAAQKAAAAAHGRRNGNKSSSNSQEYTGTLKTVIKINRNNSSIGNGASTSNAARNKQHKDAQGARRQSLKMTFQKGRARGHQSGHGQSDQQMQGEEAYYTIQNEVSFSDIFYLFFYMLILFFFLFSFFRMKVRF